MVPGVLLGLAAFASLPRLPAAIRAVVPANVGPTIGRVYFNFLQAGAAPEVIDRWERGWQIATQPLSWVFVVVLAAWLGQVLASAGREASCVWRRSG